MANTFTTPSMDWTSPGDIHKRFRLFKQKCDLIFEGPLEKQAEDKKVRLLLLWIGDKGLEIYNTAEWANDGDDLKLEPVFQHLEAYTKPKSNHILARFQLRSLKQGEMSLEEFVTKASSLIDDGGYDQKFKDETLRDTLVFGVKSDKIRKDAIALGNKLTFQEVYDLAKTEESTKAQMKVITQGGEIYKEAHSIRSKKPTPQEPRKFKSSTSKQRDTSSSSDNKQRPRKFNFNYNGCFRCGANHDQQAPCPAINATCKYCKKKGHFLKVCMKRKVKRLHEIVDDPSYEGQDIHLQSGETPGYPNNAYTYEEEGSSDTEPITVILGSVSTENSVDSVHSHMHKIYRDVKLNDKCNVKMKIDTGADTCVLTTGDLQILPMNINLQPSDSILKGYGGSQIQNLGVATLKVTFKDKSIETKFNVVEAPGNSSMIGCKQAQDLGIITVNIDEFNSTQTTPSRATQAAQQGNLSQAIIEEDFKDCFDKVGRFPGEKYHINLIDNPTPVVHPARTVAVHVLPLYKEELDKMIRDDIITEVTEPTEWVNSIVCKVSKTSDGKQKVRLCLDPKDLNKNIRREHYYSRTIDEILPLIHGKNYFSVADTRKGYWHVELDHASSLLCTFNTPFGRFRFKRLPFGVNVSQDVFQRKLDEIYRGIPNVAGIADDIIITGSTKEEHDQAFLNMLNATRKNNVSLNSDKLQFKKQSVNFYGHTITQEGIKPSSDKLEMIKNIQTPTDAKELLSILGMITYLNRYSAKLAQLTAPLRELTKKNTHFKWEDYHQDALDKIKEELCSVPVMSYYDPNPETVTILQCDASQKGLGAWIRQIDSDNNERIIAMSSRSLTDAEKRYSNIERECLAVAYGLQRFEYYLLGRTTIVETDHSPLEQIFKKSIAEALSRLQRLLLKCSKFDVQVRYKPGKAIPVADALSRVCLNKITHQADKFDKEIHFVTDMHSPIDINLIKSAMQQDTETMKLKDIIYKGWPSQRKECPQELLEFWNFRCDLVLEDGLILKGDRILIPSSLRKQVLDTIHLGHQGETKCILLARETVFWPRISNDIRNMIKGCDTCNKHQSAQARLPILQPDLPDRPWEKLGTDIFEFNGSKYLMIVDYYSRFPIVRLISNMTASTICNHFSQVLGEYGLPSYIHADFGTQYVSKEFRQKCENSGIKLTFSSPYHHQANSVAERAIGSCKALWKKALDEKKCPYTALWMYRTTPLSSALPSPHELLYGRKPKRLVPSTNHTLQVKHPDNDNHKEANQISREKQADNYNRKAGKTERRPLHVKEPVYVYDTLKRVWNKGEIMKLPNPATEPRTYIIEMNGKLYQRTREHLRPRSEQVEVQKEILTQQPLTLPQREKTEESKETNQKTPKTESALPEPDLKKQIQQPHVYTTRYGRTIKPPIKLLL